MKIGLYECNVLTDIEKANMVLDHGTFMVKRHDDQHVINLYALSDFYVELYYDAKSNRIKKIRSFKFNSYIILHNSYLKYMEIH